MTAAPDREAVVLPTRAYLRSVLEQTVPVRRLALADSVAHFAEALESGETGWSDMAFLGVVGDAMQVFEDLAYIGESMASVRFPGLPAYVGAITYDGHVPTRFYERRRSHADLRVLASYSVRDPADGTVIDTLDLLGADLPAETRAAWLEAEEQTVQWMSATLDGLGKRWKQFSRYFHAYKHGGLTVRREDVEFVAQDGETLDPGLTIWVRKKGEPVAHGDADISSDLQQSVRELAIVANIALEFVDLVVSSRLGIADHAATHEIGTSDELVPITLPVRFKLGPTQLSPEHTAALEAIGLTFARQPLAGDADVP